MRIKDVVTLRNEKTTQADLPYIALENIVSWDAKFIETEAESDGTNNLFYKGDILFGKLRPYLAKGYTPNYDGMCSSEFLVMKPKKGILSTYLLYYILSHKVIDTIKNQVTGVKMPRTNWASFSNLELDLPSLPEQTRIVSYLDEKTGAIDHNIAVLTKERDAYQRLKASIINHAVTRGIIPNVPLKHSGLDWLGMVPEHWKVKRLKDIYELRNGYTPSKNVPEFWEGGTIPWFRMEDIRKSGRVLSDSIQHITKAGVKGNGLFEAGSFILATTATIGEHAVLIADSLANQRFTNLKVRKSLSAKLITRFLFYHFFVIDRYCHVISRSTTFSAVNMDKLKMFPVYFPPLPEQQAIATYLDTKCAEIDGNIANIDRQIEAYKRLRHAIINEVTTGKRKV